MLESTDVLFHHFRQLFQVLVCKACPAFCDCLKCVIIRIVRCQKHCTINSSSLPSPMESSDNYQIHSVSHLALIITFILDPQPTPSPSLINRVPVDRFAHQ